MNIIPAIDIIQGKCVRLTGGSFNSVAVYADDPVSMAMRFEDAGLKYLHLVDLDGARKGKSVHWNILEAIASSTDLHIDFSGGIRTKEDVSRGLSLGAKRITVGSLAVQDVPKFKSWLTEFGVEKFNLSADVRNRQISTNGWQRNSEQDIISFLSLYNDSLQLNVICTDISRDGRLQGPALDLYRELVQQFPSFNIIASGGVSDITDIERLQDIKVHGIILGKALYEGKITLTELSKLC